MMWLLLATTLKFILLLRFPPTKIAVYNDRWIKSNLPNLNLWVKYGQCEEARL